MAAITTSEIDLLSKYILAISGIKLDKSKAYLIENRLSPILKEAACTNFSELYHKAKKEANGHLQKEIIDAISTNETFFFRDNTPFDLMKNKIIPEIIDRRAGKSQSGKIPIKIWSAACSTGQEVYSIAITLLEMLPDPKKFEIYILGTDISSKAVSQASYGKYSKFEVERGLSPQKRQKYFTSSGNSWRIKDEVRALANFKKINLMQPFKQMAKFDLVFCRNVAIYFSTSDKMKLFRKIGTVLQPDGALLVGGSENLASIAPDFRSKQYLKGIYYELKSFKGQETPLNNNKPATTPRVRPAAKTVKRKTNYDHPKRQVVKKSNPPPPKKTACQPDKPAPQAVLTPTAENCPEIVEIQPPVSLAEQLAVHQNSSQENSLLGGIQDKEQGPSLLSAKESENAPESSLLDKINRASKE